MNFTRRGWTAPGDGAARPVSTSSKLALTGVVAGVLVFIGVGIVAAVAVITAFLKPHAYTAGDPVGDSERLRPALRGPASSSGQDLRAGHLVGAGAGPEGMRGGSPPPPMPFALRRGARPGTGLYGRDVEGQPGDPAFDEYTAARQEHTREIQEAYAEYESVKEQHEDDLEEARTRYQAARREQEQALTADSAEYEATRAAHQQAISRAFSEYEAARRRSPGDEALAEYQQAQHEHQAAIADALDEYRESEAERQEAIRQALEEFQAAEREHQKATADALDEYRDAEAEHQKAIQEAYEHYRTVTGRR